MEKDNDIILSDVYLKHNTYVIRNVPHIKLKWFRFKMFGIETGHDLARYAGVEIRLSRIYKHMVENGIFDCDYDDYKNI